MSEAKGLLVGIFCVLIALICFAASLMSASRATRMDPLQVFSED
ncbi:hypothetical protein P8935_02290 [Telmatobacter sp. DSM 110680]|uniref:Uncharacterized protein n=1 Tax=Telmatobacter sp. DSM 110680 TaxID=3036704 RepID=A0AAU7DM93_9BACT